jgi:hypothetical protein
MIPITKEGKGVSIQTYINNLIQKKQKVNEINPPPKLYPYFWKHPYPASFTGANPKDTRPYPFNDSLWNSLGKVTKSSITRSPHLPEIQMQTAKTTKTSIVKEPPLDTPPEKMFPILISVLYRGSVNELKGCNNDIDATQKYWVDYRKVPLKNITRLVEGSSKQPTRSNICSSLYQLLLHAKPGDKFFLSYSGHGGDIPDTTGTEASGRTQIIFPLGFETDGVITDD